MQQLTRYITVIALLCTAFTVHSQTTYSTENVAEEDVAFEVMHNTDKNSGRIIFKGNNCSSCPQKTITYNSAASATVNGYPSEQPTLNKSFSGFGDISYNPNTLTLDHLNIYQQ